MRLYDLHDYANPKAMRDWQQMSPFERHVIHRLDSIAFLAAIIMGTTLAAAAMLAAVLLSHLA